MSRFKAGDRVQAADSDELTDDVRNEVGTVMVPPSNDGEAVFGVDDEGVYLVRFDREVRQGRTGLYVIERHLMPHVDRDLSTLEQVEDFLAEEGP